MTVILGILELLLAARFVGLAGPVTPFTAPLAAISAWSIRVLAESARAGLGSRASWQDTALLRVLSTAIAAGALALITGAAIAQSNILLRVASEPAIVQWAVLSLLLAGYLNVRIIVDALFRRPEPRGSKRAEELAEELVGTWESPSRRVRFMYGTAIGAVAGVFFVTWEGLWLLVAAGAGPIILPLLIVQVRLVWRFAAAWIRMLGRFQLAVRKSRSGGSAGARPDVLYLRSFPTDRWRVRAEAIRYPAGKFGRPPLEEVLLRRLWAEGTVLAAENPGAFAAITGPIGAAKSSLPAESWHITLVQWMRDASLIVAVGGTTGGLLWELGQLERLGLQDRLFFVIPPVQRKIWWRPRSRGDVPEITQHWNAVCRMVDEVGGMTVPATIDVRRTRAVVPGVGEHSAYLILSEGNRDFDYEAAVEVAASITLGRLRRQDSHRSVGGHEPAPPSPRPCADDREWPDLPKKVRKAMSDARPVTRHRSVQSLYQLTFAANPAVRMAAVRGLERLAGDQSGLVLIAASKALAALGSSPQPPPPAQANPPPALQGGPPRRPLRQSQLWLWVAGAAVMGSTAALILALQSMNRPVEDDLLHIPVPGQAEVIIDSTGSYTLYFEGPGATDEAVELPPFSVSLTSSDGGQDVPFRPFEGFSAYSIGGHSARAIGTIEIDKPGKFLIRVSGDPQAPGGDITIGPHRAGAAGLLAALTAMFMLLVFICGVCLAIVVLAIRLRADQMKPSAARPPEPWKPGGLPGWYTDPDGRYELRYWDGQAWTVHIFQRGIQTVEPGPGWRAQGSTGEKPAEPEG
ncbi:DUF2510 domain-containing protein [Arthrobacter sp. I2-34]|uniref:DUF2510 domain-containing protein n=1 Tax=Arthrobacter hankyongi TaxID=2904801 RepID=A0ABS9L1I7_9MICC|nr:DUF2510 domain-containing protein [Arthrobacter hankyongi]MCG2620498.1 DUF2510 domain-containing protein [Arthrobacter hankyongi]